MYIVFLATRCKRAPARGELLEVYPIFDADGKSLDISLTDFDMAKAGNLSPGESADFNDSVEVYAGTPGTLGNFSVTRKGTITVNPDTGNREFNGVFIFEDTFDFNASDHRPWSAEFQVTVARNLLPGLPFEIYGELPVSQVQGQNVTTTNGNGTKVNPADYPKPKPTETRQEESN